MAILKHANRQTGVAFPGIATLVKICQMSRNQVIRSIKTLEEKGVITVKRDELPKEGEKRQRKPNHYTVCSLSSSAPQILEDGVVPARDYPSAAQGLGVVPVGDLNQSNVTKVIEPAAEPPRPNIFSLYETALGTTVTAMMKEKLIEAAETYPEQWIQDAFDIASNYNARNWKYVNSILERWVKEGKPKTNGKQKEALPDIDWSNPPKDPITGEALYWKGEERGWVKEKDLLA